MRSPNYIVEITPDSNFVISLEIKRKLLNSDWMIFLASEFSYWLKYLLTVI